MRVNRKKFDNAYDRCWVSVPKCDFTFKNGMDNPEIKEDILDLYRYKCTGKCTKRFERWLRLMRQDDVSSDLENVLFGGLFYFYCYAAQYEWWENGVKVNWFDPQDEGTWQQIVDGCRPLFELFDEIEERREYERERWRRRYADPDFRKREVERSKKRLVKWLADDKNREHYNARAREYYQKNCEKIKERRREYYWGNRERINERHRNSYRLKKAQKETE